MLATHQCDARVVHGAVEQKQGKIRTTKIQRNPNGTAPTKQTASTLEAGTNSMVDAFFKSGMLTIALVVACVATEQVGCLDACMWGIPVGF